MASVGNNNLYAYRYDWDDHRRLVVKDFRQLIGAAHATEIPLLAGNMDLAGGHLYRIWIYPPSFSKGLHLKYDEVLDKILPILVQMTID